LSDYLNQKCLKNDFYSIIFFNNWIKKYPEVAGQKKGKVLEIFYTFLSAQVVNIRKKTKFILFWLDFKKKVIKRLLWNEFI